MKEKKPKVSAKKTRQIIRREARKAYESEYYKAAHDYARRLLYMIGLSAVLFLWAVASTVGVLLK